MKNKKYIIKDLIWDTNYFSSKSVKIDLISKITKTEYYEIQKIKKNYEFLTIINHNNDNDNNYLISLLENTFLVDVNIRLNKDIFDKNLIFDNKIKIYNSYKYDPRIINITKNNFLHSRFFNDFNLDKEKKGKIYEEWTKNSFNKKDKYFLIYEQKNVIKGFIIFKISKNKIDIELICVNNSYKNQKIGSIMLQNLESFSFRKNIKVIEVGTQVNNISAIRFYIKNGYKYFKCNSIYHSWRLYKGEKKTEKNMVN